MENRKFQLKLKLKYFEQKKIECIFELQIRSSYVKVIFSLQIIHATFPAVNSEFKTVKRSETLKWCILNYIIVGRILRQKRVQ